MKIVRKPEPDVVTGFVTNQKTNVDVAFTLSFGEFLKNAVETYPLFGKGLRNIRRGSRIIEAVEAMNGEVRLEDEDWSSLKDAVNEIQLNPKIARKFIPFIDAVEGAKDQQA